MVNMDQLNENIDLFSKDLRFELMNYKDDCDMIKQHFSYPQYHNGLLLHTLLFNTKNFDCYELDQLSDWKRICYLYEDAKELLKFGCRDLMIEKLGINKVDQLMETLQHMHVNTEVTLSMSSPNANHHLAIGLQDLSEGDEHWLESQLSLVDDIFLHIHPDCDMVGALQVAANVAKHSPFDQMRFNKMSVMLNTSRFDTIIRLHPELQALSVTERESLIMKNFPRARLLLFSRINTRVNFFKQMKTLRHMSRI